MLLQAHLTSHSRMSNSRWGTTLSWLSRWLRHFLYSLMYSCHLFLISSASVISLPFLSFIVPIFTWNVPLISLIFLKRSLVFPFLLFSSICTVHLRRPSYLSFLFSGTLHSDKYIFPFLPWLSLLFFFSAICKASSDYHFAFLHFFLFGMVLITASYTIMLQTSIHSSSGTLSFRSNHLNLFVTSTV